MKILLLGGSGLIGQEVRKQFAEHEILAPTHEELDLTVPSSIKEEHIAGVDLIINAAGYTDVDKAEKDRKACWSLNALAVGYLAAIARSLDIPIVHFSSLYIFDGLDEENPKPMSYYAMSKYFAEMILEYVAPKYYLIRTVRVFGPPGSGKKSFVELVKNAPDDASFVVDEYAQPTYVVDLVKRTKKIVEGGWTNKPFNVVNYGCASWLAFAKEVRKLIGKPESFKAVSRNDFHRDAPRPGKLDFETNLRPWEDALKEYLCP